MAVESNFNEDTIERCMGMFWDSDKGMIIDEGLDAETEEMEDEENLVGFVFDNTVLEDLQRPSRAPMPHDDDSISTFRPSAHRTQSIFPATTPSIGTRTSTTNDSTSAFSSSTTDKETIRLLENRITGLTSQMIAQQNKQKEQYEALLQALQQQSNNLPNEEASSSKNSGNQP